MSYIGEQDDWAICGRCGWTAFGVWATEEAANHGCCSEAVIVGSSQTIDPVQEGCSICNLVAYLPNWLAWHMGELAMWEVWSHTEGGGVDEPDGLREWRQQRPILSADLPWQGLDQHDPPAQSVAALLPFIACRQHEPQWFGTDMEDA